MYRDIQKNLLFCCQHKHVLHIYVFPPIPQTTPSTIFITDKTIPIFLLQLDDAVRFPTAVRDSNRVYFISFFLKAEVYFCAVFLEVVTASLFILLSSADQVLFISDLLLKMPKHWDICIVFPYTCAFWKWMSCFREGLLQEKRDNQLESCNST